MSAIRQLLLRLLLRLPVLHRTVSRRFLLLTGVDGRPLTRAAPVRYAAHEEAFVALARPGTAWWQGLPTEGDVPATARFKGREVVLRASLASGEVLDEAILRYLQKYPGEWRALEVHPKAEPDEVEAAAHQSAVAVFRPAPEVPASELRSER